MKITIHNTSPEVAKSVNIKDTLALCLKRCQIYHLRDTVSSLKNKK